MAPFRISEVPFFMSIKLNILRDLLKPITCGLPSLFLLRVVAKTGAVVTAIKMDHLRFFWCHVPIPTLHVRRFTWPFIPSSMIYAQAPLGALYIWNGTNFFKISSNKRWWWTGNLWFKLLGPLSFLLFMTCCWKFLNHERNHVSYNLYCYVNLFPLA